MMMQTLVSTAAAAVILSGHGAQAAQSSNRALSTTVLPDFCADGCHPSLCECTQEGFGNPALCANEIHYACNLGGFRGCLPDSQVAPVERIFCPYSASIVNGVKSEELKL
eukprot:scaffold7304_cov135-Skeletonema_menzelii.AAC.3